MADILTLTISYPDFKLNDVIDPEQFDTNNSEIVGKMNEVITSFNTKFATVETFDTRITAVENHSIDAIRHITATERTNWDTHRLASSPHAGHLTSTHYDSTSAHHDNRYFTEVELQSATGTTGAELIGCKSFGTIVATTVYEALVNINNRVTTVTLGLIPDGSITKAKMAFDVATCGVDDSSVSEFKGLVQDVSERSVEYTYDGNGNIQTETIKNGGVTVKTTTLNYTNGNISSIVEVVNGKTITTTLNYTNGNITSATKDVV